MAVPDESTHVILDTKRIIRAHRDLKQLYISQGTYMIYAAEKGAGEKLSYLRDHRTEARETSPHHLDGDTCHFRNVTLPMLATRRFRSQLGDASSPHPPVPASASALRPDAFLIINYCMSFRNVFLVASTSWVMFPFRRCPPPPHQILALALRPRPFPT